MASPPTRAMAPTGSERILGRCRRAAGPRFVRRSSVAPCAIRAHQIIGARGVSMPRRAAGRTSPVRRPRLREFLAGSPVVR